MNTNFIRSSDVNLGLVSDESLSKCSLIINLKKHNSFVGTSALRVEILILRVQFAYSLESQHWRSDLGQILEAYRT